MKKHIISLALASLLLTTESYSQIKFDKGDEQGMDVGKLDLGQDSIAVQAALSGWWKDSQKTLNERMSWYNDAKFGCFIHWGVYSGAGGEWKGKPVTGYSEHLMRKEKISLQEYKDKLVIPFNPVDFDADEWMRHAKEAGMRYFIITAKHHDGFAMYFSDAYPYDMRMTEYKKDPMKELRAAATKYGIKFGFYYSHAFDWEHPDAPGNDWDYNNPGGDKLIGGANWWLTRTDFIPHADKYVTEKSIPQIVELIKKYNPDILWFDTPHKLPLYENIRILKSIREASPDIVVNGRLARFSGGNLGDYINTGDRAAYFFPVKGYWESIPTTNESYGYSKYDLSHKTVSHFVRLVSSATSKGGNILMNVGPMGNGKWDEKDIEIFKGVGEWLSVYGEAIYGNERTDLPVQTWGVTTKKDGITYLHIYNWPKDGKLIVGGLTSDIDKAWIVGEANKSDLKIGRLNDKDIKIALPVAAPDTINTVVALTLKNKKTAYPVRLLSALSDNILYTFDAELKGKGLGYGDGKPNRNYVRGWNSNSQSLQWKFRINESANYDIYIDYNTESEKDKGSVTLNINGKVYKINYVSRLEKDGTNSIQVGQISIPEGEYTCLLEGDKQEGVSYMRPIAVRFIPTN
ncbi:alpha-L-fucosidase [Dysgonomonas alginatilytica]|uniref:alpha-L-fucosidase n=1 Tax=Dysgonomonas alginatilytica TaxID=1605892 RepID=A0A2V3PQN6_9BACT|nr:alpha-L-fucosidase [Dysgonomonas alginatilytica]PXV66291.1 alpha-L-fucosidase [Dysgonomonas alginatilytica]